MIKNLKAKFENKKCILLGAGVSNMPLAKMLLSFGAHVEVRDKKTESEMGERAEALQAMGATLVLGEAYLDNMAADYIFRSPGFRPDMEPLQAAAESGAKITAEMDEFLLHSPCTVIGVTGSDGKSTTTTIISEILKAGCQDKKVFLGGNIGEPLLNRIADMNDDDIVAAELSSFQLMSAPAPVTVAVIKNVTPNHLNWHTGMEEYIWAKAKILEGAKLAVLNYDDQVCRRLAKDCKAPIRWFSRGPIPREFLCDYAGGVFAEGGKVVYYNSADESEAVVMDTGDILLPGEHNMENYCTAVAATLDFAPFEAARAVAKEFGGVKHRFQLVRIKDGVKFYNSSIDSSPTRTAAALSAAPAPVHLICGGYDKNIPFEPLADAIFECGKVKTLVLTGATADKIKAAVIAHEMYGKAELSVIMEPDFTKAVLLAAESAESGDSVLLSPACASFDAFENFEKRGERFAEIVKEMI